MIQHLFGTQEGDLGSANIGALYGGLVHGTSNLVENRLPWIVPGTFRNLVFKNDAGGTWTLYKNGVATALTCNGDSSDQVNTLAVSAADVAAGPVFLHYRRAGATKLAYVGNPVSSCLEFESADDRTAGYGNTVMIFSSVTGDLASGPFGGGQQQWSGTNPSPNIRGNYYHVVKVPGEIVAFGTGVAFLFNTDAAKGLRLALALNGVIQDGSGGTPDTRITTLGGGALETLVGGISTGWSIPVVVGDIVEVYKTNVGDLAAGGISHAMCGAIQFRTAADSAHQYMICGATQSYIVSSTPLYASHPGRLEPLEDDPGPGGSPFTPIGTINIGGVRRTTIIGLLSHAQRPSGGNVNTLEFQLRKNEATPANAPILLTTQASPDLVIDTDLTHQVTLDLGDVWDTRARSVEGPNISTQYHWTYVATAATPPPPINPVTGCPDGLPLSPVSGPSGCAAGV